MEMAVTTGEIRRAKLQSNHHHQQTNTQLYTGPMPFLSPNQQCQSTEGNFFGRQFIKYGILIHSGGFRGGRAGPGPPPLGDGPTVTENGTVSCDASMIICLSLPKPLAKTTVTLG